jgi:hypothetical protein
MCSRIIAAKLNEGGQYDSKYLLNGFCTWCQGQSNTPEELGFIPVAREYRFQTEWKFGKNRCGDYNKCEVEDSEKLYNQCVWEESAGKLGIDPKTLSSMSESETKTLFLTKGFCYDGDDPVHSKIVSTCDKKLLGPTVSAENTYVPDKTAYWPKGTSMGNWVHECNNGLSNNYYCTWCPSLRGSVTQRSLEVIIGSAVGSAVGSATISCAVVGILIATKVIPKGAMIGISVGSVLVGVIVGILLWLV